MENTNLNIPKITVTALVDTLSVLYSAAIKDSIKLRTLPTAFLWGAAGVGKSEGVYQLAEKLKKLTHKKVEITDVRLLLFSPVDLRGVPVADSTRRFTTWLMPAIFNMQESDEYINILFLDELSSAPQSLQAAAYQICLDRRIGEHKLPENCIVIAAGNRITDQSISYKMPKALCNRLMHFSVESDPASWRKWAVKNGIDSRITGYIAFAPSKLCVTPQPADLAYPTPRSWNFVSNLLTSTGRRPEDIHQLIGACVGTDTALEFENWCRIYDSLPPIEDILKGTCVRYPKTFDQYYALVSGISFTIINEKNTISLSEMENVVQYAKNFPADFAMSLFQELNAFDELHYLLMKCRGLSEWLQKNKKHL